MRLVPKNLDHFDPVLVVVGTLFMLGGAYALGFMGVSGPLLGWLLRGIPGIFVFIGITILVRQFQVLRCNGNPKDFVPMGVILVLGGGFTLYFMGPVSPVLSWLIRAIFAIPLAVGLLVLIWQFQLWRKRRVAEKKGL